MSLLDAQLTMAVRIADAATVPDGAPACPLPDRLAAFHSAYRAIAGLPVADEAWAELTLVAAWRLVESAHPRGAPIADLVADLGRAHAAVVAVAREPEPDRRTKPRRDA